MKKLLAIWTLLCASSIMSAHGAGEPSLKECIAPAKKGGGWDFTCRSVSALLFEERYVPAKIKVTNMPGAGGGTALMHVATKRKKDNGVFVAASTATVTRLARFRAMDAKMVRWPGALGSDYGVIAVSAASKFKTLQDLLQTLKAKPAQVKFAGSSSKGGWDHLKVLLLAKAGKFKTLKNVRYSSYGSGKKAIAKVLAGSATAFSGDISEIDNTLVSKLKILAVLSDQRLPAPYSQYPTAVEQGVNVIAPNWRGFYLPKSISEADYNWWAKTLDTIAKSNTWRRIMQKNGLMPFQKSGKQFENYVKQQEKELKAISKEIGILK